jgi:hypothetical protein
VAIRTIVALIPAAGLQEFYDYLLRYGELLAADADALNDRAARMQSRKEALVVFELAEALRSRASTAAGLRGTLKLSSRPVRNAARVCLSLGAHVSRLRGFISDDAAWYFERAAHFCFHVIGNHSQVRVEQIGLLIIQAMAVRLRGRSQELPLAMKMLKRAEWALVHYPDRTLLWIRFYLERAKLFRARANDSTVSDLERTRCRTYLALDVYAVIRLADDRSAWSRRARELLRS